MLLFLNATFFIQQWNLYGNFCFVMGKINISVFFEQIQDKIVYVRSCFAMLDGSHAKQSKVKPCA